MSTEFRRMQVFRSCAVALILLLSGTGLAAAAGPRAPLPQWRDPSGPPAETDIWLSRLVGRYSFDGLVEVVYEYDHYPEHRCGPLPPDPEQEGDPPPPTVPYCSDIRGRADCVAIGTGPGVQCILDVTWTDMHEVMPDGVYSLPGGVSYMSPAMILFGLDPGESAINYLLVDNKGLPEGGLGFITGSRATFKTTCVNAPTLFSAMALQFVRPLEQGGQPLLTCERTIRIDARPDARILHMAMDIEINDEMFTRLEMTLRRESQTE